MEIRLKRLDAFQRLPKEVIILHKFVSERAAGIPASSIRKMFNIAQGMEDVVNLGIGEPDFTTPGHIIEESMLGAKAGATHYTHNAGYIELRKLIAKETEELINQFVDPENEVIVTIGAMGALSLSMLAVINPGDEIIVQEPLWSNYVSHCLLAGGQPVTVPVYEDDDFNLKAEEIERKITARTKAILINSPCNPTGAVMSRENLEDIAELVRKYDLLVISDEVYDRIVYDGTKHVSIASLPGMKERTVIINSFSKTYAMTGWRVGYAVVPSEIQKPMVKLQESIVACAPSISQKAAITALQSSREQVQEMINSYDRRRKLLVEGLQQVPGFSCKLPKGTFYLFANIKQLGRSSEEVAMDLLTKARVVTVPGSGFGQAGEGYLRFSFANSEDNIKKAVERIDKFIRQEYGLS